MAPVPDRELIDSICLAARLGQAVRCRRSDRGSEHSTYRVETDKGIFAVRVASLHSPDPTWQRHAGSSSLKLASRLVGQGILEVEGAAHRYAVWEWIQGRLLDYGRDLRRMADGLAQLHRKTRGRRVAPSDAPDLVEFLRGRLIAYSRRMERIGGIGKLLAVEAAAARIAASRTKKRTSAFRCLVHNDLVRGNVLVVSGRMRLIDWDWSLNASPALDLCGFLSPFTTSWEKEHLISDRGVSTFMRQYLRHFPQREAMEIMRDMVAAWEPFNAMMAYWVNRNAGPGQNQFRSLAFYRRCFVRVHEISQLLQARFIALSGRGSI